MAFRIQRIQQAVSQVRALVLRLDLVVGGSLLDREFCLLKGAHVRFRDTLPLNASNKVLKTELREWAVRS